MQQLWKFICVSFKFFAFLKAPRSSFVAKEEQLAFKDCAEAFKSGMTSNGIYTLTMLNTTEQVKVSIYMAKKKKILQKNICVFK